MNIIIRLRQEEFTSFEEFGKNIYRYPDESFKLINSSRFLTLLKKEGSQYFDAIMDLRSKETSKDKFLFKAQYVFSPLMSLRFRDCSYHDFKQLGKRILNGAPKIDVYILDLIRYQLLSYYMEIHHEDKSNKTLYEKIKALEEEFILNENRVYFKLGFTLAESEEIVYRRRGYSDISSFFDVVLSPTIIEEFASDFEKSQYLFAWLEIKGLHQKIQKYESIVLSVEEWEEKTK